LISTIIVGLLFFSVCVCVYVLYLSLSLSVCVCVCVYNSAPLRHPFISLSVSLSTDDMKDLVQIKRLSFSPSQSTHAPVCLAHARFYFIPTQSESESTSGPVQTMASDLAWDDAGAPKRIFS
jgi:hypothetical protein